MSARTRLLAGLATACLAIGCTGGPGDPGPDPPGPAETPVTFDVVERPHFRGAMPVTLQVGRIVYTAAECPSSDQSGRVCDPDDGREYLLVDDPGTARVAEARMDPTDGNTAWTVTVVVSPKSTGLLRGFRERARETGGLVLVLDESGSVLLLTAPVPRVESRRLVLPGLTKADAWKLVERFTQT